MKTYLFLLLVVVLLLLAGCKREPVDVRPKLEAAIERYLTAKVGVETRIDSVMVVGVDTLTEKGKMAFQVGRLLDRASQAQREASSLEKQYNLMVQSARLDKTLYGRDHVLTDLSIQDAKAAGENARAKLAELVALNAQADSLNRLVAAGRFDSLAFLGYRVRFLTRVLDVKSGSVTTIDTLMMMVDPNFHVIENQ